jgi:hypothetical protein
MAFLETLLGYAGRVLIGDVTVDCSISETHSRAADITEHPVEEGSDIADHYRAKPREVQINGMVSSTPLETGFPGQTLVSAVGSIVSGDDPVKNAWEIFNQYIDDGELVTISTSLQEYPDVGLSDLSTDRNHKTGQVLSFTVTAKQLRIVTTSEALAIKLPKTKTAGKEAKKKGKQPTKAASEVKDQSALAKGADKGADFLQQILR